MNKTTLFFLMLSTTTLFAQQQEADFRRTLNNDPKNLQAYLGLISLAKTRQAISQLGSEATKAMGARSAIYVELGNAFTRINDFNNSIVSYQQAIALNPRSATTYNRLGLSLLQVKNYRQAEVSFRAALTFTTSNNSKVLYYTNLAQTYRNLKSHKDSKEAIEAALKINPKHQTALNLQTQLRTVAPQLFQ